MTIAVTGRQEITAVQLAGSAARTASQAGEAKIDLSRLGRVDLLGGGTPCAGRGVAWSERLERVEGGQVMPT